MFLYTSLIDRTCTTADDSARRITHAVRAIVSLEDNHSGPDDESGEDNLQVDADTWSPFSECVRCNRGERNLCRTTCRRQQSVNSHRTNEATQAGAFVTARISVNVGRILATLYADNTPARWVAASSSWWPQPRTTQEMQANCEWLARRCRRCGRHEYSLFARQPIEQGEELTVPRSLAPRAGAAIIPYEVVFDGGTCTREGNSAAGAGSLLRHIHSRGPPTCIARAVLAIPGHSSAPLAESHACGLALHLLAVFARGLGLAWQHTESSACWRMHPGHSLRGGSGTIYVR